MLMFVGIYFHLNKDCIQHFLSLAFKGDKLCVGELGNYQSWSEKDPSF